jgi:hypothetical protein
VSKSIVQPFGAWQRAAAPGLLEEFEAPEPDDTWELDGGTAWVYYSNSRMGLVRPVLLSDGFSMGPSCLNELYEGLNEGAYAFIDELRRRGYDLVLIGYNERSALIQDNARAVTDAIMSAVSARKGSAPLTVGGFSMGGLVTRYALARLELRRMDHETALYVSYDSPHRGAWIPISLQALAHFLKFKDDSLSNMINSPAAKQLLWRHLENLRLPIKIEQAQERTDFLDELDRLGGWPQRPKKIGVANGSGTGVGNGLPPGEAALEVVAGELQNTALYLQDNTVDQVVADLRLLLPLRVRTSRYPRLDSAPGGTLESFGIAADALSANGQTAVSRYRKVDFVPAVSAVAIRDVDTDEDLYADISRIASSESELDEFLCSEDNDGHTVMTERLGGWILDRLPR